MRRFKFVGDPSDYDWNVELIKNYIYNEDVELNGFMGILSTLEMAKDQDANDPILADWQEVFDPVLHKDTDFGYFSFEFTKELIKVFSDSHEQFISIPDKAMYLATELIKQLNKKVWNE